MIDYTVAKPEQPLTRLAANAQRCAFECIQYDSLDAPELELTWKRLHASVPGAGLFTSYDWCRCWLDTVGADFSPCVLVAQTEEGTPAGLAPLCVNRKGGVLWLQFMGRERVSGDHLDIIARPDNREAVLEAVLAETTKLRQDCDGLILGEIQPKSLTHRKLIDWARQNNCSWYEREHRRVPFIDLPESFEAMLAQLSANMRYHVRRRRRAMERVPTAEVELIREGPAVHDRLEEFFELHARRWQVDGLPGNFRDQSMREFLHRFCHQAAEHGMLRLFALRLAGSTQAVLICFHHSAADGGTASYYQMGWAPDCPIDSPGVILLSHSIQQAIAEGLCRYDFLRGDEAYKWRWTDTFTEQTTLAVGWNWSARAAIAADTLKNRVKSAITSCMGPGAWDKARRLAGVDRAMSPHRREPVPLGDSTR